MAEETAERWRVRPLSQLMANVAWQYSLRVRSTPNATITGRQQAPKAAVDAPVHCVVRRRIGDRCTRPLTPSLSLYLHATVFRLLGEFVLLLSYECGELLGTTPHHISSGRFNVLLEARRQGGSNKLSVQSFHDRRRRSRWNEEATPGLMSQRGEASFRSRRGVRQGAMPPTGRYHQRA